VLAADTSSMRNLILCKLLLADFYHCLFPDKLDGIRPMKRRREESPPLPLSDDDDPYDEREEDMRIGKKRVRGVWSSEVLINNIP